MMQWIDLYAAPILVLLLIAAIGGFFVHERMQLPARYVRCMLSGTAVWCWCTLGAVMAIGMLWMVWNIRHGGTQACLVCVDWQAVDGQTQAWVHAQERAWWLTPVKMFTQLGHLVWMAVLGAVACIWLLYRRAWLLLGAWVVGVAGVGLWVRWIKSSVARERPDVRWVFEQGYSFPSGHSAGTLLCYGMLAWLVFVMAGQRKGYWATVLAALVVLGVGLSRIVLGAHYVSDVVAGWMLGLAWMSLVFAVATLAQHKALQRRWM